MNVKLNYGILLHHSSLCHFMAVIKLRPFTRTQYHGPFVRRQLHSVTAGRRKYGWVFDLDQTLIWNRFSFLFYIHSVLTEKMLLFLSQTMLIYVTEIFHQHQTYMWYCNVLPIVYNLKLCRGWSSLGAVSCLIYYPLNKLTFIFFLNKSDWKWKIFF